MKLVVGEHKGGVDGGGYDLLADLAKHDLVLRECGLGHRIETEPVFPGRVESTEGPARTKDHFELLGERIRMGEPRRGNAVRHGPADVLVVVEEQQTEYRS